MKDVPNFLIKKKDKRNNYFFLVCFLNRECECECMDEDDTCIPCSKLQ